MTARVKSEIAASALIRRAQVGGAYATVIRRGDNDAGALHVMLRTLDGLARLYTPIRNMEGDPAWLVTAPSPEGEIDLRLNKLIDRDPDIWIVEIEDRDARHFLTEPVEEG